MQAIFFMDSFNVFDDEEEEKRKNVRRRRGARLLVGKQTLFANGFEVADADVIIAAASPTSIDQNPKAASCGKNESALKRTSIDYRAQ